MHKVVRVNEDDWSPGEPGKGECHEEVRDNGFGLDLHVDCRRLSRIGRTRSSWCLVDFRAAVRHEFVSRCSFFPTAERIARVVFEELTRLTRPAVVLRARLRQRLRADTVSRRMPLTPKALLFDFDGVIVDSEPLHCQSYLETAAAFNLPLTKEQYYNELIGFDDRGAIAHIYRMFERKLDTQIMASFIEKKSSLSLSLIRAGKYRPLIGVDEFVRSLAERCAMGICSGALRSEIEGMLDGIGLRQFFGVVTAAEDVAIGKPDPSGYILTAKRLGEMIGRELRLGECLVIEDAPTVALRARDAGFAVLGVTTTYRADDWPADIPTVSSLDPAEVLKKFPLLPLEK